MDTKIKMIWYSGIEREYLVDYSYNSATHGDDGDHDEYVDIHSLTSIRDDGSHVDASRMLSIREIRETIELEVLRNINNERGTVDNL